MAFQYWSSGKMSCEPERDLTALRPGVLNDKKHNNVITRHVPYFPLGAQVLEHTVREDNACYVQEMGVYAINTPQMSLAGLACNLFWHEGGQKIWESAGGRALLTHGLKVLWLTQSQQAKVVPVYLNLTDDLSVLGVLPVAPSKRNPLNSLRQAVLTTVAMMDQSYPDKRFQGIPGDGGVTVSQGVSNRLEESGIPQIWKDIYVPDGPGDAPIPIRSRYTQVQPSSFKEHYDVSSGYNVMETVGSILHRAMSQMNGNYSTLMYATKLSTSWVLGYSNRMGPDGFTVNNDAERAAFESLSHHPNPHWSNVKTFDAVIERVRTIDFKPGHRPNYVDARTFQKQSRQSTLSHVTCPAPATREAVKALVAAVQMALNAEDVQGKKLTTFFELNV